MFQLFISLRYLRQKLLSDLCLAGLALGVAILVIVNSVMAGFTQEFHRRLRGTEADIAIEAETHFGLADPEALEPILRSEALILKASLPDEAPALLDSLAAGAGVTLDRRTLEVMQPASLCGTQLAGPSLGQSPEPAGKGEGIYRWQLLDGRTVEIPAAWVDRVEASPVAETLPFAEALVLLSTPLAKDAGVLRAQDPLKAARQTRFVEYILSPGEAYREAYGRYYSDERFGSHLASSMLAYSLFRQGKLTARQVSDLKFESLRHASTSIADYAKLRGRDEALQWHKDLGPAGLALLAQGYAIEDLLAASQSEISGFEGLLEPDDALKADPESIFDRGIRPLPGLIVSIDIFRNLDARLGEPVTVTTVRQRPDGEFESREAEFEIIAVYKSGFSEADGRSLFCAPRDLRALLEIGPKVHSGVDVNLKQSEGGELLASVAKESIERRLQAHTDTRLNLRVETWEEGNLTLVRAVATEKAILAVIMVFMGAVAGLILLVILLMMVNERVRDIGILKAVGASTQGVLGAFLLQGFFIGITGAVAGLVLGLLGTHWVNEICSLIELLTGWHPFPRDVYYLEKIPTDIRPRDIVWIVCPVVLTSLVLSLYPAYLASRLHPTEALRRER